MWLKAPSHFPFYAVKRVRANVQFKSLHFHEYAIDNLGAKLASLITNRRLANVDIVILKWFINDAVSVTSVM